MRSESCVHKDGIEYVSIKEFAERVGASHDTIRARIRQGKLAALTFGKDTTQYLNWEVAKTMWDVYPKNTSGRKSKPRNPLTGEEVKVPKTKPKGKGGKFHKANEKVSDPRVHDPSIDMPSVEMPDIMPIEDMSSFDKMKYADCLDEFGEFDYDKLKVRLTSEAYKLKQDKDRGLLVEKVEVVTFARKLGTILNNGLESIPQRYTSILLAKCQTIIASRANMPEFEFTEEERAELRACLKACGPEIMKSLKLIIEEMTEDSE